MAVSGRTRLKQFPDTPTFYESGVPDIESTIVAMHGPAGIPADTIAKLNATVAQAGKGPEFVKRMDALNALLILSTPEELRQREETRSKWAMDVARTAGIQPQ